MAIIKDQFTVGEMAKLHRIPTKTLRYYDNIGHFKPARVDPQTGYRYYQTDQFEMLSMISYLRQMGMPIRQIKFHLENRSLKSMIRLLEEHRERVRDELAKLRDIESRLAFRLEELADRDTESSDPVLRIENLPSRNVVMIDHPIETEAELELQLRKLDDRRVRTSSPFIGDVGLTLPMTRVQAGLYDLYESLFLFLEPGDSPSAQSVSLPGGLYAVYRFSGSRQDSRHHYPFVLEELERRGYEWGKSAVERCLVDFSLTSLNREYRTQIEIPLTAGPGIG